MCCFFLLTTAIIKNHNLQATAPATTSLIPALGTGMRILAQASFATGVRVMGEIGRVLDGTGEKETTHRKNLLYLMQSVSSILVPSHWLVANHYINASVAPYFVNSTSTHEIAITRLMGPAGTHMPESPVGDHKCGTHATGWLSG